MGRGLSPKQRAVLDAVSRLSMLDGRPVDDVLISELLEAVYGWPPRHHWTRTRTGLHLVARQYTRREVPTYDVDRASLNRTLRRLENRGLLITQWISWRAGGPVGVRLSAAGEHIANGCATTTTIFAQPLERHEVTS